MNRTVAAIAGVILSVAIPAPGIAQSPDLVLTDARVFTADPDRPWVEALAVRGERIVALGSAAEIEALAGPETETIDLGGRVVVPGLNDAHAHAGAWPEGARLDLGGEGPLPDPSWDEVLAALPDAVAGTDPGTWIFGTIGPRVIDNPLADRSALDRVAPDHPVWLEGNTGHGLLLNTAALETLGIPADAEDPIGGWYGREAGGALDGWAWEAAAHVDATRALTAEVDRTERIRAYRALAERAVQWGLTTVQHMSNSSPAGEVAAAVAESRVPLRWTIYRWPTPRSEIAEAYRFESAAPPAASRIRFAGAKWVLDATPIERYALMREPYADRTGWHGRPNYAPGELRAILAGALQGNEQLALHAAGDSTLALVTRTMLDLADPDAWRPLRIRIEHGDGLFADLVPAVRDLGMVLVQNPLHFATPDRTRPRVGERADAFQPLASVLDAGVPVALGADAGGEARNPWLNVMLAVAHPANPDEALTVEQAVIAYTRGAAIAERREAEKGTLAKGMLADLAVLSQDVFGVPPDALPATTSVLTMIGGEIVHRDPSLGNDDPR